MTISEWLHKDVGSHAQFVNALWRAVVRAQELLEEAA
jgi:hypothetical protein